MNQASVYCCVCKRKMKSYYYLLTLNFLVQLCQFKFKEIKRGKENKMQTERPVIRFIKTSSSYLI
jgi:hypothetical protein